MAEVLLFHHAQGLTPGVRAFADELRGAGHIVHTADLFDGRTFQSIEEGLAYIGDVGFDDMRDAAPASLTICLLRSSMPGSRSACCLRRSWPRRGPEREELSSSIPACRSVANGPSDLGQMACLSRFTGWKTTRSS